MKISPCLTFLILMVACLSLTLSVQAQNSLGYATVDYDEETNTVYGYAYTDPDYSADIYYYQTYVGAYIYDANNNVVASFPNHTAYGRAEISFEGSGTGYPPYRISSGHMVFMTYYVSNYWDPRVAQYRTGWLDFYYYTFYSPEGPGYPVSNIPLFFDFTGRNPHTVTSSLNRFLGTLLSFLFPLEGEVLFNTAQVYDKSGNFQKIVALQLATISMNNSSHAQEVCGDNPQLFTLRVNFSLRPNTTLAPNRCTARPVNIPDHDYNVSTVTCMIDDSFNNKGHMDISVRRKCCNAGNANPKISVGVGCNMSGPGVCDTKAVVTILC